MNPFDKIQDHLQRAPVATASVNVTDRVLASIAQGEPERESLIPLATVASIGCAIAAALTLWAVQSFATLDDPMSAMVAPFRVTL